MSTTTGTKEQTPAERARHLLRACDRGVLATRLSEAALPRAADDGLDLRDWPYASLVLVASDLVGRPLLLISTLAAHTRNVESDSRCSLLLDGTGGGAEALAGARLSVMGRMVGHDSAHDRARFVRRHPSAAQYADFADFGLFRLEPARAHLVAGFGKIDWIASEDLLCMPVEDLSEREYDIVSHMNEDHADAIALYATKLLGLPDDSSWRMTGIDPEGIDLRAGDLLGRLAFPRPLASADDARPVLVDLVEAARASG